MVLLYGTIHIYLYYCNTQLVIRLTSPEAIENGFQRNGQDILSPTTASTGVCQGCLELVIVGSDVGVGAVRHAESARDGPQLGEAELLVEVAGAGVGGDHGVELKHAEARRPSLRQGSSTRARPMPLPLASDDTA